MMSSLFTKDVQRKSSSGSGRQRGNSLLGTEQILDIYGFPLQLSEEDKADRESCHQKQLQRTERWIKLAGDPTTWNANDTPNLKKLIRKGIPPLLRPEMWYHVSGAARRAAAAGPGYYANLLRVHAGETTKATQIIDLDIPRTFPGNEHAESEVGKAALQRVLYAFSFHNTHIGYCQSLNYIAGLLLLVMHNQERTFWVLTALIEDILYASCHAQDLLGCHVEQRVLKQLLEKKMPSLAAQLDALHCDLSIITTEWVLCVFVKSLPAETAARVLDSLLFEGSKVLFRVSLALFKVNEEGIMAAEHMGDIMHTLQGCTRSFHHRDRLMKIAFDGIGSLPMKTIEKRRGIHQEKVEAELRERGRRISQQLGSAAATSAAEGSSSGS